MASNEILALHCLPHPCQLPGVDSDVEAFSSMTCKVRTILTSWKHPSAYSTDAILDLFPWISYAGHGSLSPPGFGKRKRRERKEKKRGKSKQAAGLTGHPLTTDNR